MTAKYFAILTNQGAARLANAAALGTKLNLTQMAVGDANGTLPTPDQAQTKLINQKRIAPLNLLTVDPANTSQIIAEQIIPENEGGFWIREIGLYDDDGILIAVANCPETYKPQLQEGSGRTQTIRMILIVSSTSSITLKIDPSVVLATRKYADDKAIELKLYVDDLMSKHLAAADPHSQYATKDSPTFTGKPKAPTPPVVANDTQVATAGFVQAVIAALVSGELANKQPLDKTLTDLSGKDVAAILEYLGFGYRLLEANGYFELPGGFLLQWGSGSVQATNATVRFKKPFNVTPFIVLPHKITADNRYVTSVNYTLTGFSLYGWNGGGVATNIDSYTYLALGM
ncbi:TPA: phage tail protein [Klebsiella quasipneumoniae]|nr:phage tail protein [Klebsiella quasipneumoniae]